MSLRIDDENREASFQKADLLEEQGLLLEALQVLLSIDDETDALTLTRVGRLLQDLGRLSEAESKLRVAIQVDSEFWRARFYLGLLYREQGELERAEAELFIASQLDDSASSLNCLGVVQLELGLKTAAQESFRKAIKLDPTGEEAMYNLATTLVDDESSTAADLFERAIALDPNYGAAHRELGWYLRRKGKLPEALYHIQRSIELNSDDGWSRIYLGNLLWLVDDFQGVEAAFQGAIKIWPDSAVGYWCLAFFYERQGRHKRAERLYEKAIEIDPEDAQANWRYGNYLKNSGDEEKSRYYLERSFELYPGDRRVLEALEELDKEMT
jgi:tetratricopeptide (TPR) repeat protein